MASCPRTASASAAASKTSTTRVVVADAVGVPPGRSSPSVSCPRASASCARWRPTLPALPTNTILIARRSRREAAQASADARPRRRFEQVHLGALEDGGAEALSLGRELCAQRLVRVHQPATGVPGGRIPPSVQQHELLHAPAGRPV